MTHSFLLNYLKDVAPVLFLKLDQDGIILETNRYGESLIGPVETGTSFSDILLDFHHSFDLKHNLSLQPQEYRPDQTLPRALTSSLRHPMISYTLLVIQT